MRKALSFRGRASRSEFWSIPLWLAIGCAALSGGVDAFAALSEACAGAGFGFVPRGSSAFFSLLASACAFGRAALLLWGLAALFSTLVRRLHDVGLSGWLTLAFAPLLFLPGFIVASLAPQPGPNAWGPPPSPVSAVPALRFPWARAACALLFLWTALTAASFALDRLERRAVFAAFDDLSRHEAADLWAAPAVSVRSFSKGLDLVSLPGMNDAPWNGSLSAWGAEAGLVCLRELRGTERVVAGFSLVVPASAEGRAVRLCQDWLGIPLADPAEAGENGLLAEAERPGGQRTLVFFQPPDPASDDPSNPVRFCVLLHSVDETIAALIGTGELPPHWLARVRDGSVRGRAALRAALASLAPFDETESFFPDDDATLVAFLREDLLSGGRRPEPARAEALLRLALGRCSDAAAPALAELLRDRPDLPPETAGELLDRMARADPEAAFGSARRLFLAALDADRGAANPDATRTLAVWEACGARLHDDDFLRDVLLRRLSWGEDSGTDSSQPDEDASLAREGRRALSVRVTAALLPAVSDPDARRAVTDEILRSGRLRAEDLLESGQNSMRHSSSNDKRKP